MLQIRKGCFETNSSSTHAIIVSEEEELDTPWFDVNFAIGNFGWEIDILHTIDDKASYLYTAACIIKQKDVFNDLKNILAPCGIECYSTERARFHKTDRGYEWLDNGDIDHAELEDFVDYIFESPEHLIRYLFDDRSYVVTSNDNCDEYTYDWFNAECTNKPETYKHKTFYKGN